MEPCSCSTPRRFRRSRGGRARRGGVQTGGDRRNREYAGPPRREHGGRCDRGAGLRPADRGRPARLAPGREGGRARGELSPRRSLPRPHRPDRGGQRRRPREAGSSVSTLARVETCSRARAGEVSARRFAQLAAASLAALFLVVTSGAFVRLTGVGPRLRELAGSAATAVSRAGLPRVRRVRQPRRGARRDHAGAGHVARLARVRGLPTGAWRALAAFSAPSRRSRSAGSRSCSSCTRSR